jgi:hypothetical protein
MIRIAVTLKLPPQKNLELAVRLLEVEDSSRRRCFRSIHAITTKFVNVVSLVVLTDAQFSANDLLSRHFGKTLDTPLVVASIT